MLAQYRELFIEEAKELFDSAINVLLEIEKNKNIQEEQINQLFRDVHTLKGSGASVELIYFTRLAHELENLMDKIRRKEIEFKIEMLDLLLKSLDLLQEILSLEIKNEIDENLYLKMAKNTIEELEKYINQEKVNTNEPELKQINKEEISIDEDDFGFFVELDKINKQNYVKKIKENVEDKIKKEEINDKKQIVSTNNIRVDLQKIDVLMNNVGELVITNAMLKQYIVKNIEDANKKQEIEEKVALLERHIREMQDSIMSIRMVPMESIYSKFPKMIRDTAKKLNKQIDFQHYGDSVEIDKAMIENLTDPLMHIVRNSIDHGIEKDRGKKNPIGKIIIKAEQTNGQIIITIEDDGQGVNIDKVVEKALSNNIITEKQLENMNDNEKAMLIFHPGLSTAEKITDISGRGVGMDVVKSNIEKIDGKISLETKPGVGTKIVIVLPLTLAILDGLEINIGEEIYILPLNSIVESLKPTKEMIKSIGNSSGETLMLRDEFIPIIRLYEVFKIKPNYNELVDGMLVVVKYGTNKVALFIDRFLQQHQIVVKPLDKNFKHVIGFGAATVNGDGSVGLILDINGIIELKRGN